MVAHTSVKAADEAAAAKSKPDEKKTKISLDDLKNKLTLSSQDE